MSKTCSLIGTRILAPRTLLLVVGIFVAPAHAQTDPKSPLTYLDDWSEALPDQADALFQTGTQHVP